MRTSVSDVPPAANGAMNLTVLAGQVLVDNVCAWPGDVAPTRSSAAKPSSIVRLLITAGSTRGVRSFRRLLERQQILRRAEVDDLAVLDHPGEMTAALQDRDIGDRVLLEDDDVGELARSDLADLAFEADRISVVLGGRDDRLH